MTPLEYKLDDPIDHATFIIFLCHWFETSNGEKHLRDSRISAIAEFVLSYGSR